ncbi:WD repeat-containing protein 6 [Rhizina undulata]
MKNCLHHISNASPTTSLCFLDVAVDHVKTQHLLVGEGSFVKLYNTVTGKCILKRRVFTRERIHGIQASDLNPREILFWGGKSLCVTSAASLLDETSTLSEHRASDWIFFATFLPSPLNSPTQVSLITAHNSLLLFHSTGNFREIASGERCILYSANLLYLPPDASHPARILAAAGTVFGEILIWSVTINTPTPSKAIHHRLLGHEGSIFGVNISPVYKNKRYLASCSDDRTIRIWDISNLSSTADPVSTDGDDIKKTGFGHDLPKENSSGGECLSVGWGHQARIWGVRFLPSDNDTPYGDIRLVSISEDLTSKFWEFPGSRANSELKNVSTHLLHSGKHIWSFAFNFARKTLATGGADGRVSLINYGPEFIHRREEWNISTILDFANIKEASNALEQKDDIVVEETSEKKKKKKKPIIPSDSVKSYAIVDSHRLAVTTVKGRVMVHDLTTKQWRCLGQWQNFSSWSVVAGWEYTGYIVLGDGYGKIAIINVDSGSVIWWEDGAIGKVASVYTAKAEGDEGKYYFVTSSLTSNSFWLHSFEISPEQGLYAQQTLTLAPPSPNFVVTSICIDHTQNLLFLGSRKGGLAVYKLHSSTLTRLSASPQSPPHELSCLSVIFALHDSDAITTITTLLPSSPSHHPSKSSTLLTAGRNGTYSILTISSDSLNPFEIVHVSKPPNCSLIEGAYLHPETKDLLLYGFHGKFFFVYNETKGYELVAEDCGGAHRAWIFRGGRTAEEGVGWLVWTKASRLHISHIPYQPHRVLQPGLHGRELKALSISPPLLINNLTQNLIATGAEDTAIRLSVLTPQTEVQGIAVFKRHTTGIQHLAWSSCGKYLFSSGGVEEFFVWRIRAIDCCAGVGVGVVVEAVCPVGSEVPDLRLCGFDVIAVGEEGFLVGMGLSDSGVKVYYYKPSTREFTLLFTGRYKESCLLHCKFYRSENTLHLLIAGTDGYVSAYNLTPLLTPTLSISVSTYAEPKDLALPAWSKRVHQSSIKALTLHPLSPSSFLLLTGGDDCAFGVTLVRIEGDVAVDSWMVPRVHASAVTGIAVVGEFTGGVRVVTAGWDQRVRCWEVGFDDGAMSVRGGAGEYSGVADVAGVGLVGENVVVGGVGMEVWRWE